MLKGISGIVPDLNAIRLRGGRGLIYRWARRDENCIGSCQGMPSAVLPGVNCLPVESVQGGAEGGTGINALFAVGEGLRRRLRGHPQSSSPNHVQYHLHHYILRHSINSYDPLTRFRQYIQYAFN